MGAGLAGASVALALCRQEDVLILEAKEPGAGASGVAGGLFSPMIALRGRPVWRIDEAVEAFQAQLEDVSAQSLFDNRGVLRPAKDEEQATFFKQSVDRAPSHAVWLPAEEARERYPLVETSFGAMLATSGGAISLINYTRRLLETAQQRGARLRMYCRAVSWGETENTAYVDVSSNVNSDLNGRLFAKRVILAGGDLFFIHPALKKLDLHAVKGQTVRTLYPTSLNRSAFPPVSGTRYVIPEQQSIAIGSSFEHQFEHREVDHRVSEDLLEKATTLIPSLQRTEIKEEHVGIRVTVPKIRLPMIGPLPNQSRIWVFTAFGSKGLLLAPLLANELSGFLENPETIPDNLQVRLKG